MIVGFRHPVLPLANSTSPPLRNLLCFRDTTRPADIRHHHARDRFPPSLPGPPAVTKRSLTQKVQRGGEADFFSEQDTLHQLPKCAP